MISPCFLLHIYLQLSIWILPVTLPVHKHQLLFLDSCLISITFFFPVHTYRTQKLWIWNAFQLLWLHIFCNNFLLKHKFKELIIISCFYFALLCISGKSIQIFPLPDMLPLFTIQRKFLNVFSTGFVFLASMSHLDHFLLNVSLVSVR